MIKDSEKARAALYAIPPDVSYDTWLRAGTAALAAGLSISEIDTWSSTAENYKGTKDVESTFRNVKQEGGITAGTLFYIAAEHGYMAKPFTAPNSRLKKTIARLNHPLRVELQLRYGSGAKEQLTTSHTLSANRQLASL